MKFKRFLALGVLLSSAVHAADGYYRFPSIAADKIVFTAEGDLWLATTDNPTAKRLTTHTALERFSAISPDGRFIAYVANYEGSDDVYLISADGGIPKRLSFENGRAMVHGWTPDGGVIYSTNSRIGPPRNWTLNVVYPDSLKTLPIEVADAREGVMDKDGRYVYFSQFGVGDKSDNVRVYRGGAEGEIWRYEYRSDKEAVLLTGKHVGNARQPMSYKDKVYFISDASGVDNIWQMKRDGSNIKQVTHHKDWPVRSARLGDGKIVYQLGADIQLLSLRNGKSKVVPISLVSDFPNLQERWLPKPLNYISSVHFSGEKEKVAITARGRVAVAAKDNSRLVEIATPAQSRTREAVISPDGKWVYAINDASGEQEIWRYKTDGSNDGEQLTTDGSVFRWDLFLSPDGKYIAHSDKNGALWLLNIDSGENKQILSKSDGFDPIADVVFSADSKLIALSLFASQYQRNRIVLYEIESAKQQTLTSGNYTSYSPAFSPDGKWLYFLSDRNFNPSPSHPWGDRNMGPQLDRRAMIFAYSLKADAAFPFQPSTELTPAAETKDKDKTAQTEQPLVDWQGITERLWQVKAPVGNYWHLTASDKFLYVQDRVNEPGSRSAIKSIAINAEAKVETFAANARSYQLSGDGKSLLITKGSRANTELYLVKAAAKMGKTSKRDKVSTNNWSLLLSPRLEWQQMFQDAWLQHRDTLFDKNLKGLDWSAVKAKYQPLLSRLTDKWELNDLLGQMMGELNTLHSQIRPGEVPSAQNRAAQANLGAVLHQLDSGVEIAQIYRHDAEFPWRASPLAKAGVDARNGDVIVAVNGRKVNSVADVVSLLRNQVDKQVLLTLRRDGVEHKTVVEPSSTSADERHRYAHWVNDNRGKVENASEDIGYMHLWTMGSRDLAGFAESFYANNHKQGLIIDVRRNRGGNIDSIIIEKLLRKAWSFWYIDDKNSETNMQKAFRGHIVVLADQGTYSDGETFTAAIKALNIGPVIGKRTAGAGVFLTDRNALVDRGMARAAELPQFSMDGRWIIEGYGVAPTIEVDNLPHASYQGKDAQLEKAIEYLQQKIKEAPVKPLKVNPYPQNGVPAEDI